jgi:hypothetical protein
MNGSICNTGGSATGRAVAFCGALLAIACAAVYTVPAASADDAAACAEVSYLKEVAIPACTRLIESGNLHDPAASIRTAAARGCGRRTRAISIPPWPITMKPSASLPASPPFT